MDSTSFAPLWILSVLCAFALVLVRFGSTTFNLPFLVAVQPRGTLRCALFCCYLPPYYVRARGAARNGCMLRTCTHMLPRLWLFPACHLPVLAGDGIFHNIPTTVRITYTTIFSSSRLCLRACRFFGSVSIIFAHATAFLPCAPATTAALTFIPVLGQRTFLAADALPAPRGSYYHGCLVRAFALPRFANSLPHFTTSPPPRPRTTALYRCTSPLTN